MAVTRNALGRGLGALLLSSSTPGTPAPVPVATPEDSGPGSTEIAVASIDANPEQPRRHFDSGQLEQLAASIRRHGVLQPVVVRRAGERFELVVGERRFRASQAAGLETIPAVIADIAPAARLEVALVENVQRQDLNPIELAQAYRALADAGHTQDEIGERVGLDRSSVANHMRLLELARTSRPMSRREGSAWVTPRRFSRSRTRSAVGISATASWRADSRSASPNASRATAAGPPGIAARKARVRQRGVAPRVAMRH